MNSETHEDSLFLQLVAQHANMALMFMGLLPGPEKDKPVRDLDVARAFIDRLEMLKEKTKGNLTAQEAAFLNQSLTSARMAFVEIVEQQAPASVSEENPTKEAPPAAPDGSPAPSPESGEPAGSAAESEERKKFVKKY